MSHRHWILSLALVGTVAAGCAEDPAADAPKAEVGEAGVAAPAAAATDATETYTFDNSTSSIGWVGSKVTGSHEGGFHDFSGEVTVADGAPQSVTIDIDTNSIYSDTERLTEHLKSADFFDVEQYPTATFTSTSIEPGAAAGEYTVAGDLELHGVTKNIRFPATIEVMPDGVTADAEFSIKRFDWNINYEGKADDLIRDEVLLQLDIQTQGLPGEAAGDMAGDMAAGEADADDGTAVDAAAADPAPAAADGN